MPLTNKTLLKVRPEIMRELFPKKADYELVLSQLSESIREAKLVAPNAWAVTLFQRVPRGFRLNVGRVEVLTAFQSEIRLLIRGTICQANKLLSDCIKPSPYKSVPGENSIFGGTAEQFRNFRGELLAAHYEFIGEAGRTKSGKAVSGTKYRKSHSSELAELAESVAPHPLS